MSEISEHIARQRSDALVISLVGREFADKWWQSPNKAFDLRTPEYMWTVDYIKVYEYLLRHSYGEW